ncbi:MAG: cupin domain-containing protein [Rhodobacteraceae bacterium]|nr:cupin domain-containing protein [Paracoccaceae bacterium]
MLAFRLDPALATPENDTPSPARVIAGAPEFTTWDIEARGGLHAGIWQATPGTWHVHYDEWEYFRILEGHSVLTDADGTMHDLRAGDSMVVRPGFKGTWEVRETTRKDYVILLPGT